MHKQKHFGQFCDITYYTYEFASKWNIRDEKKIISLFASNMNDYNT